MDINKTFIEQLISNELLDINDFVEYWHTHKTKVSLREFLGLTEFEYNVWAVNTDKILNSVRECRIKGISFEVYYYCNNSV